MVMRNRHDGAGSSGWDDLPPRVRDRMRPRPPALPDEHQLISTPPRTRPAGPDRLRDLARFALLFVAVAVANILFLLLALCYLHPRSP